MLNYILDELKKIMAIDSPSGFTRKAADYIMQQLREFGFHLDDQHLEFILIFLGGVGIHISGVLLIVRQYKGVAPLPAVLDDRVLYLRFPPT